MTRKEKATKGSQAKAPLPRRLAAGVGKVLLVVIALFAVAAASMFVNHRLSSASDHRFLAARGFANPVDLGGRSVNVHREGRNDGAPTLVFLPGLGMSDTSLAFRPLYSRLSGEYGVAVVDRAGYGLSDDVRDGRGIEAIVAEQRAALIGAGVAAPYVLVAHSISGMYATYWANAHPAEVASIIFLDAGSPEFYVDEGPTGVGLEDDIFIALTALGLQRLLPAELEMFETERHWPFSDEERRMLHALDMRRGYAQAMKGEKAATYGNALAAMKAPAPDDMPKLAIVADMFAGEYAGKTEAELRPRFESDAAFDDFRKGFEKDIARNGAYLSRMGNVELVTIPGSHLIYLDAVDEVAKTMGDFLARTSSR